MLPPSPPRGQVWGHVQPAQGEAHQRAQLVAVLGHLAEALQVDDEDVGQRPEAELHRALLRDPAVRAAPRVVRCQLLLLGVELEAFIQRAAVLLVCRLLQPHAVRILHHLLLHAAK